MPWATASSAIYVGGLLLCIVPFAGCFGWIGTCIGAFLLVLTGFGGVVTQPWSRAILGVVIGEIAAFSAVLGAFLGVIGTTEEGQGGVQILAVIFTLISMPAGAAWAYLRWDASPIGRAVVAIWSLCICVIPGAGYAISYAIFGQSVWYPF